MDLYALVVYFFTILVAVAGGFFLGRGCMHCLDRSHPDLSLAPQPKAAPSSSMDHRRVSLKLYEKNESVVAAAEPQGALVTQDSNEEPRVQPQASENEVLLSEPQHRTIVIVSFTLPLKLKKNEEGEWMVNWDNDRSIVGNFSKLRSENVDVRFVGFPNVFVPKQEEDELEDLLGEYGCYPVFLTQDMHDVFLNGFCKGILWPLFHYQTPTMKPGFASNFDNLWQAYQAVNMAFANKVTLVAEEEDDCIWIHNYQLFLTPSFLRKKTSRGKVALFIHTVCMLSRHRLTLQPFPSSDMFRCLPVRANILRAMLCADMIGFQTYDYARHFFSSLKRILDLDFIQMPGGALGVMYFGRNISIRINHVGILSETFASISQSQTVKDLVDSIRKQFPGRRLVISVDDLDPVKGTVSKFQAIQAFFVRYPDFVDKVTMVAILFCSSNQSAEQIALKQQILDVTGTIKKDFGDGCLELIIPQSILPIEELISFYVASDIALLASFWDGLNICPFEYTACQPHESPGSVIVSEFMGCSRALSGVNTVNPWKLDEVAEAIHDALEMSTEQRVAYHQQRYEYVMRHSFQSWVDGFLADLDAAAESSRQLNFVQVGWGSNVRLIGLHAGFSHLEESEIVSAFRGSKRRLLLLDYDGTLTEESNPQLAAPTDELLRYLHVLSEDPHNLVFIISGRERKFLDLWFESVPRLGLAAEKGVYYRWPNSKEWEIALTVKSFAWKDEVMQLMQQYTERTDGSRIEPKESALVWHYEAADPEYGKMQASELVKYLEKVLAYWPGVDVVKYDYNRLLEVKPRGINKGVTAHRIMKQIALQGDIPDFVLCVGDDRSDEEMFVALMEFYQCRASGSEPLPPPISERRASEGVSDMELPPDVSFFTCCVGIKPSAAKFYLHDPSDVVGILKALSVLSAKFIKRMGRFAGGLAPSPTAS